MQSTSDVAIRTDPVPIKGEHEDHVKAFEKSGKNFVIGGSLFPHTGACLFLSVQDEKAAKKFVEKDPYYKKGLVVNYELQELSVTSRTTVQDLNKSLTYRP